VSVALVDYGSGNLHSAAKALERAARDAGLDERVEVTCDPAAVARADRIVLPGVGAFADCRRGLDEVSGMVEALEDGGHPARSALSRHLRRHAAHGDAGLEHGVTPGLGWISGDVAEIRPDDLNLKIPHMGWNTLDVKSPHPLLDGIATGPTGLHAYFVHSYALTPESGDEVVAVSGYGGAVTAIVARDNMAGTQFHPEKSQALGLSVLANFLRWRP
jgi:glutamine amidotransferase